MNNIQPIFLNPDHQKIFEQDGYIKITLFNESQIDRLHSLYHKYYKNTSSYFYSSSYENNFKLKKEISDAIGQIISPFLENVLKNYTWFGSAFLTKGKGLSTEMPMHQDWTIVDESMFYALNIWTPLQVTTSQNGTLEVIPGSHRWHKALRAPTLPFYYEFYKNELRTRLKVIDTQPGEAIILNQAIIHYSKPNLTDEPRIAITSGVKTSGAPMFFHYWDKNDPHHIEVFKQEDDFLIRFKDFHQAIFKRPEIGTSLGKVKFELTHPNQVEMNKILELNNMKGRGFNLFKKLTKWKKH